MTITGTDDAPAVDGRDPASLVPDAADEVLRLAATWLAWDGAPRFGDGNAWAPHKALRRVADHLLDHLAEIEALLAGQTTVPDTWHGRAVTLDSDWARFTEADLDEAASRLRRYSLLYRIRLGGLSADELDRSRPEAWTLRQIADHVSGVSYYAQQVGDLTDDEYRPTGREHAECEPGPGYRGGRRDHIVQKPRVAQMLHLPRLGFVEPSGAGPNTPAPARSQRTWIHAGGRAVRHRVVP